MLRRLGVSIALLSSLLVATGCVLDLPQRDLDGGSKKGEGGAVLDSADPNCGNATLDQGERCDTAITGGEAGACPASCDDGLACTSDSLEGVGCGQRCVFTPISACADGDGCCPAGCDHLSDDDCSADCGNGALDAKETCDTAIPAGQAGACPTRCDDANACTDDELLNPKTCAAQCRHVALSACVGGDGCCPTGCDSVNDGDCSKKCGDAILDEGEKCDTGIAPGLPGACPASCNDGNACTVDKVLNAGTCNAQCSSTPISQCQGGDNCCPTQCDAVSDSDCSDKCGNGVKEGNERCDTAIAAGQPGACPASCDDNDACTTDTLLNAGGCAAECRYAPVQNCKDGDGCCPGGCNHNNDKDCTEDCGNGVKEGNERCDKGIAAGQPGACPKSCNDSDACTIDTLHNPGGCHAYCSNTNITSCTGGDGCCPTGCNANNDSDCTPKCGNNVVESGEKCDGNCPSSCPSQTCKNGSVSGSGCQRECTYSNKSNGSSCSGGRCYNGSCCQGCWNGSSCQSGTSISACGDNGGSCSSCSTSDPCKAASCTSGSCSTSNRANGTTCPNGRCAGGSCCTGCRNGSSCVNPPTALQCGDAGGVCQSCGDGNSCTQDTCTAAGTCQNTNVANGTACPGGRCSGGSCCQGCLSGSACRPGTSLSECGSGGGSCQACSTTNQCKTASCSASGNCVTSNVSNGTACTMGTTAGKCYNGNCCTGCWDGTSCELGMFDKNACGFGGVACRACTAIQCCNEFGVCIKDLGHNCFL